MLRFQSFKNISIDWFLFFRALDKVLKYLNAKGQHYISYSQYNLSTSDKSHKVEIYNYSDTVILLQGQVSKKNKRIVWTIKNYLNNYKNIVIVISTWDGVDCNLAREIVQNHFQDYAHQIKILANATPSNPGVANINLQIVSTLRGLEYIKALDRNFVMKSRTDQGIFRHNGLQILKSNWSLHNVQSLDREKIVIGSRNTFLFRYFSFSDMLQFASIDTLLKFWSTPLDEREAQHIDMTEVRSTLEWSQMNLAETYLVRSYLAAKGSPVDYSFKTHLEALTGSFIVVDSEVLDFSWTKYTYSFSPWRQNSCTYPAYEVTQDDWLNGNLLMEKAIELERFASEPWT